MTQQPKPSKPGLAMTMVSGACVRITTPYGEIVEVCVEETRSQRAKVRIVAPRSFDILRDNAVRTAPQGPIPTKIDRSGGQPPSRLLGIDDVPVVALRPEDCDRVRDAAGRVHRTERATMTDLIKARLASAVRTAREIRSEMSKGAALDIRA